MPTDQQMAWWTAHKQEVPNAIVTSWSWSEGVDLGEEKICISAKCFTPDVTLLGPDGEITLADALNGTKNRVFAINKDGKLVIDYIEDVVLANWDGDVYDLRAIHCDIAVTSNHDMLVSTRPNSNHPWSDVYKAEMQQLNRFEFRVPTHAEGWSGALPPPKMSVRDFLPKNALVIYDPAQKGKGRRSTLPECFYYYPNRTAFRANFWDLPTGWGPPSNSEIWIQDRLHSNLFPWDYDTIDMIRLLAWYISEGNLFHNKEYRYKTAIAGETWGFAISQNQGKELEEINELLKRMGIPYSSHLKARDGVCVALTVHNIAFYWALLRWCGEGSRNKRIPRFILDANTTILETFFDTIIKGDGWRSESGALQYSTSSTMLKNNMLELGLKLGYRVYAHQRRKTENWTITFSSKRNTGTIRKRNVTKRHYKGIVWCVRTSTGTLMAGRNHRYIFVGNCPFPYTGDPFEKARMEYSRSMYNQRTAWRLEQSLGRTRRGRPEDYDLDGEHRGLVVIVDENWRKIQKYFSEALRQSIVELRHYPTDTRYLCTPAYRGCYQSSHCWQRSALALFRGARPTNQKPFGPSRSRPELHS
jgi:DNA polymerase I